MPYGLIDQRSRGTAGRSQGTTFRSTQSTPLCFRTARTANNSRSCFQCPRNMLRIARRRGVGRQSALDDTKRPTLVCVVALTPVSSQVTENRWVARGNFDRCLAPSLTIAFVRSGSAIKTNVNSRIDTLSKLRIQKRLVLVAAHSLSTDFAQ